MAGDADFFCDVDELRKRQPEVGRVVGEIVEACGNVDEVTDLVAGKALLLLLSVHSNESTADRSLSLR
jgi:hypothetical protein